LLERRVPLPCLQSSSGWTMTGSLCALALGSQQRSKFLRESASSLLHLLLLLPSRPRTTSSHFHCLPAAATAVRAHTALLTAHCFCWLLARLGSVQPCASVCKRVQARLPPAQQSIPARSLLISTSGTLFWSTTNHLVYFILLHPGTFRFTYFTPPHEQE